LRTLATNLSPLLNSCGGGKVVAIVRITVDHSSPSSFSLSG
uniref:Kinesin motor domain-containing protein n=1 Tax=Haemonchus placei TaxID=6290 RepID=A0A0N4WIP2_HAEPC